MVCNRVFFSLSPARVLSDSQAVMPGNDGLYGEYQGDESDK